MKRALTGIVPALLLMSTLTLALNIQPIRASGTIYIRVTGEVEGTDKIERDGDLYTFTDNIYDSIVVERNNIVVDGAGYTLQGTGSGDGIYLSGRSNVTIEKMNIRSFYSSVRFNFTSYSVIRRSNITNNEFGPQLHYSSNNSISENSITTNTRDGIFFWSDCSKNSILRNNVSTNNEVGIFFGECSNFNNISENIIASNNQHGIMLQDSSFNTVSGNNITANMFDGVYLTGWFATSSSFNNVSGNRITSNFVGIELNQQGTSNNRILENNITANTRGIYLFLASDNIIYHNNFVNNTEQVHVIAGYSYLNDWDDGCEGNYWSDYNRTESGNDGIGDTPNIIDENNKDNYPLMNPYWNPGDVDHDLDVDLYDAVRLLAAYGFKLGAEGYNCHCDIIEPYGQIDLYDAILLLINYGKKYN